MFKQKLKTPTIIWRASLVAIVAIVTVASFVAYFGRDDRALAATNSTLNFQARLLTAAGSVVPDGNYNIEFKLYNAASSSGSSQGSCAGDSACLWTETRTASNRVRVVNGYLTANLGSVTGFGTSISWDQELWLTMNVGGTTGPSWDGEMTPRLKLTSVPHAFRAGGLATQNGANRATLNFTTPTANRTINLPDESGTVCLQSSSNCGFMTGSATDYIQNQNASSQTANFRISGSGRADTAFLSPSIRAVTDSTTGIRLQNAAGSATALTVDTTNSRVGIGGSFAPQQALDVIGNFQIRDAGTQTKAYRFRTSGSALDLEAAGTNLYASVWTGADFTGTQRNYLVLESGAHIARAIGTWQFRTGAEGTTRHTIDGSTGASVAINQNGEATNFSVQGDTDANLFLVQGSTDRVGIGLNNPSYKLDVVGDINSSTGLRVGGNLVCTSTGCTASSGSGDYIQNQNATDQTANFRITGTGRANTSIQTPLLDTATAVALNIGTTNATAINLNKSTTITGGLTQSGGVVDIAANGASTIRTTSGSLDVRAFNTNTLTLNTSGAGTVSVGTGNSRFINVGTGADVQKSIRIGDLPGGSTSAVDIIMGFTSAASTTLIQGGTGTSAIALTPATNGSIALTTTGTGNINLNTASSVTVKTTTNSATALRVVNSSDTSIFNVNTSTNVVTISGDIIQAGIQPAAVVGNGTNGTLSSLAAAKGGNTSGTTGQTGGSGGSFFIQGGDGGNAPAGSANGWGGNVIISGGAAGSGAGSAGFRGNVILQGSGGSVGIGTLSPSTSYKLDVAGDINISSGSSYRINGTAICTSSGCTPAAGSANYIQNQSASTQTANFKIQSAGAATVNTATILSSGSQTADLLQFQSSTGSPIAGIRPSGTIWSAAVTDPNTDIPTNARLFLQPVSNASTAIIARASSGGAPTGDIIQLQNAAGSTNFFTVGAAGATTVRSDSTTAFRVQNAAGSNTVMNVDTTNTRLGIGIGAPTSTLHVVSNNATSGQNIGATFEGAQSVASAQEQFALYSKPTYTAASGTLAGLSGGYFNPQNTAGGTVTSLRGILVKPDNTSTGPVTDLVGVGSYAIKSGTGAVTNAYGMITRVDNTNATGAITNAYGLYIDNSIETGTITNDYGLYQADSGAQNQLFGAVNITNTSANAFRVQNASTNDVFKVDTSAGDVHVGSQALSADLIMTGDITWGSALETPQSFEGATFVPTSPGTWSTGGNANWFRDTAEGQSGTASASSGNIGADQSSWLDLNYTFAEAGTLSFYWKVSSEATFDFLLFCVDDDSNCNIGDTGVVDSIDGEVDWVKVSVPVTAGAHSFRWEYEKDGFVDEGTDEGWIDNVQFTGTGGEGTISGNTLTFLAGDTMSFQTSTNANALNMDSNGLVGINTNEQTEALTVAGNFNVRNTGTLNKQYRFRTTGSFLDFEGAGTDMYLSVWSGAGFTGTQTTHIIMDSGVGSMWFPSLANVSGTGNSVLCIHTSKLVRIATATTNCNPSSIRYKKNVVNMPDQMGLDAIMALRPVTYSYKDGDGSREVGLIAEEVEGILPELVAYDEHGLPAALDYELMVANIVKGIQQQQVQINNLRQGLWDGGLVSRDTTFNSLVTFNKGVIFKGDATFEGKVNFKNKVTYNEDTAGTVTIPKGETKVEVKFKQPYERAPLVATSASEFVSLKVTDKTKDGFIVTIRWAQQKDIVVDWVATQVAAPNP